MAGVSASIQGYPAAQTPPKLRSGARIAYVCMQAGGRVEEAWEDSSTADRAMGEVLFVLSSGHAAALRDEVDGMRLAERVLDRHDHRPRAVGMRRVARLGCEGQAGIASRLVQRIEGI